MADVHYVTLAKSGHSAAINVPSGFRASLGWVRGMTLEIWTEGDCLVVKRATSGRAARLLPDAPEGPTGGGTTDPEPA